MDSIKINQNRREVRKNLINYVRWEVKKGHYPSRRFIERKFRINLAPVLFNSIKDLYKKANLKYVQKNSQELKNKKAKILTDIAISFLPKLNLFLTEVRGVHNKGVDILAKDCDGNTIGLEIKAHNKYEPIKRRNFLQLKRFIEKERLDRIILITTSSRFENSIEKPNNLEIINYKKLGELCNEDQLHKLHFVRNESIHQETEERQLKKQLIIDYTKKKAEQNEDISYNGILKDLHLHVYTYFNSLFDVYNQSDILPPLNKIGGKRNPKKKTKHFEKAILRILDYMKEEIAGGHYPSGIELGEKLEIKHICNYITMTELYNMLGLQPYHKREKRGPKHPIY